MRSERARHTLAGRNLPGPSTLSKQGEDINFPVFDLPLLRLARSPKGPIPAARGPQDHETRWTRPSHVSVPSLFLAGTGPSVRKKVGCPGAHVRRPPPLLPPAAPLPLAVSAAPAEAARVAVLLSAKVAEYEDALKGFREATPHTIVAVYDMDGDLDRG